MFGCLLGMHLATYHFDRTANYQEYNPGFYVECSGYTAGTYQNSEGNNSKYIGYTFNYKIVSVTTGLVTGYRAGTAPLLIPSVKVWNGYRIAYLPQVPSSPHNTRAIHVMKDF